MSLLDISSYVHDYVLIKFIISLGITAILWGIAHMVMDSNPGEDKNSWVITKVSIVHFVLLGLALSVPTHERMYEFKIAKFKNELVTRENIDKGVDAIERIAEKLECKYLGCDTKEESK